MSDIGRWGPWCVKCGHPSSYHGVTFCQVPAGADRKRNCDCDGYVPFVAESSALLESDAIVIKRGADGLWPRWATDLLYGMIRRDLYSESYVLDGLLKAQFALADSSKAPE